MHFGSRFLQSGIRGVALRALEFSRAVELLGLGVGLGSSGFGSYFGPFGLARLAWRL